MNDIFGYNREVKSGEILSSDNVSLDLGEGKIALLQQCSVNYAHSIKPAFEVGSSALYWINGQPAGAMNFSALAGKKGFFYGWGLGKQACGQLSIFSINAVDNSDCNFEIENNKTIKIEGAILESVTLTVQAGEMTVVQGGSAKISKMILSE